MSAIPADTTPERGQVWGSVSTSHRGHVVEIMRVTKRSVLFRRRHLGKDPVREMCYDAFVGVYRPLKARKKR